MIFNGVELGRLRLRPCPRLPVLVVAIVALAGACGGSEPESGPPAPSEVDPVAAVGCDRASIGEDGGPLVGALALGDGSVLGRCFGEPDDRLDRAWLELSAVTPPGELDDVVVLAGFDEPGGDSLAFAGILGDDNDRFVVAVNLAEAELDPQEFRLTLVHEMAHVITQRPDQLDVDLDPEDCDTFWNGNGCFFPDAFVTRWIEAFWTTEQLDSMPDLARADEEGADDRCALDPSFLGSYAASHPEEDLAESFGAFVFDLDVPVEVEPKLDFFAVEPEFVAFRDHVVAGGLAAPPNTFDRCG